MKLSLGTVQFGLPYGVANQNGQVSFEEANRIIQFARENGIKNLDTAIAYGSSEEVLGKIGVKDFQIVSKLPEIPKDIQNKKKWILQSVEESLSRLKTSSLYALLLHRSDDLTYSFRDEIFDTMDQLKKSGKVEKFGVSIYNKRELEKIYEPSRIDIVQSPLNVVDRSLVKSGWLEKLKRLGCEVQIRSVFLQGLLLMKEEQRPRKFNRWDSIWKAWESFLIQNHLSATRACLGFVQSVIGIDQLIVGVDSLSQLMEIFKNYTSDFKISIPEEFSSEDPYLINPSLWNGI